MISQVSLLEGKKVDPEWKGVCCKSCWNAEHEICRCRCGGEHHGKGTPSREKTLSEQ